MIHTNGILHTCPWRQHVRGYLEPAHQPAGLPARLPAWGEVLGWYHCLVDRTWPYGRCPGTDSQHTHNLTDHIWQVCSLIEGQDYSDIVLVGHSYGGMVITGVADRVPERIRRLVYVDAALPDLGQSLFDLVVVRGADPGSVAGLEARAAYIEKIRFNP